MELYSIAIRDIMPSEGEFETSAKPVAQKEA
jgi:hypothetical protein